MKTQRESANTTRMNFGKPNVSNRYARAARSATRFTAVSTKRTRRRSCPSNASPFSTTSTKRRNKSRFNDRKIHHGGSHRPARLRLPERGQMRRAPARIPRIDARLGGFRSIPLQRASRGYVRPARSRHLGRDGRGAFDGVPRRHGGRRPPGAGNPSAHSSGTRWAAT